ncbi:MAG: hypothetical protein K2O45_07625 [Oscillospiraceae bacterium]|nr:hypothetical protein [Oscillospiraceae bacterium]
MRKSMIHELYYGNVSPWERKRILDPEFIALGKKIDDIVTHYKKLLSPEEYKKFEEMQNLQAQADVIQEAELFEYAFCAGVLLMIDVFRYKGP